MKLFKKIAVAALVAAALGLMGAAMVAATDDQDLSTNPYPEDAGWGHSSIMGD